MAVVIKVGETEAVSVGVGEKVYIQGDPGFSPTIDVTDITGGHRLTITDINGDKTVDVMNGQKGEQGPKGDPGEVTQAEFDELAATVSQQESDIDGKQDAPTDAGTAGQVLGLDEDLNPVWLDQTGGGGGGGTTNYNNLTNKPLINGVLLSGDKSAADLGLAAASDIPTVPVQSVNGKTGAVVLDASDVGALPESTAIPSKTSDLTNDSGFVNAAGAAAASPVQRVNGQTGDVTISVPSAASSGTPEMDGTASQGSSNEYARADHVHPTDTTRAAAAELATYVRPNLLDNWYFVGGGSQQGYGKFPVNQRGQTVYTTSSSAGYNIDRWQALSNVTVTINSDNVTPKRNGGDTWGLYQTFGGGFEGKTITFSALIKTISGSARLQISYEQAGTIYWLAAKDITATGVTSVTFTAPSSYSKLYFVFWLGSTDTTLQIQAAKAEIGSTQTLAHQEGSTWVLNEIPDYSEQLYRCLDSHADSGDTYANKSPSDYLNNGLPSKFVLLSPETPAVHLPNSCRCYGVALDSNAARCGLYYLCTTGTGGEVVGKFTSSGLDVTGSTNKATFAVPSGATIVVILYTTDQYTLNQLYATT